MTEAPLPDVSLVARLITATPAILEAELGAAGDTLCRWRPAEGEWCANECVGHLIEADRRGFAGRIRTILEGDRPSLATWDQPAVAAARRDRERDTASLLEEFRSGRGASVALVGSLSAADLARSGIHPSVGELTVGQILAEWVHHDRNHVRQVLAIAQAYAWPAMGNARRFVDPSL